MSHDYHQGQLGYSSGQVLHDGCSECGYRSVDPSRAIEQMDLSTFTRAWQRAGRRQIKGLPDMAMAERPLFDVLAAVQVKLQNYGIPIGVLPGSPDAPVVAPYALAPPPPVIPPVRLDGCTCGGIGNTGSHRRDCAWAV